MINLPEQNQRSKYLKQKSWNLAKNSSNIKYLKPWHYSWSKLLFACFCYFWLSISLDCSLLPKYHVANIPAIIFFLVLEKHYIEYFNIIKNCTMLFNNIFIQLITSKGTAVQYQGRFISLMEWVPLSAYIGIMIQL